MKILFFHILLKALSKPFLANYYNMHISKNRWLNFKQNLPSLIFLSIVQIWLNFNYPVFIRLGHPWSILLAILSSIACIFVYVYAFAYPETFSRQMNLAFLDDLPNPTLIKNIFVYLYFGLGYLFYLYVCSINFHNVDGRWYVIWYAHFVIAFVLIYRAVKRSDLSLARNTHQKFYGE